ncbi:hypothetical protein ACHWQZ_G015409 [Mnemiopsis leidyi]
MFRRAFLFWQSAFNGLISCWARSVFRFTAQELYSYTHTMKTTFLVLTLMIICCNYVQSVPMSLEEDLSDEEHRGLQKRAGTKFNKADYKSVGEGTRKWFG